MLASMSMDKLFFEKTTPGEVFEGDIKSLCHGLLEGFRMLSDRLQDALSSRNPPICVYEDDWHALSKMLSDEFKHTLHMDVSDGFFDAVISKFVEKISNHKD